MRAIRRFSLTLSAVAVLLLLAVTLVSVGANSRFTQSSPKPSATTAVAKTMKTYTMYSGLWRTDGSFVSTIRIKNILVVAPLDVTPVLFMADGTPYMLPSVHVPVSGVVTVSVNDALAAAPQSVATHISGFGSVALIHSYSSPGHLSAQVAAIDASRSLSYTYPFMEPMDMPGGNARQVLEGLWWKHDSGVTGSITLSNTTNQQQTTTLTAVRPGNSAGSQQVSLAPHSTQMPSLEALEASSSAPDNHAGGIRVEYQGAPGAILVNGGLLNESEGYSANIPFWGHDLSSASVTTVTYGSAGLMLGKPDPTMMPGFPEDTTFSPYLALRNTTEKPLDVALQVNYMMGMNGSAPVTGSLLTQHLAPFAARQLDLQGALTAAGLKNFNGSINLSASFTGNAGDLVLATGSVDQTGTYVFEVTPQGVSSARSKDSNYWGVANGSDAMYSLWNPTDAAQDIVATFYYGDGSGKYTLPVHLEPQASTMIDMAMLIATHQPDANGNTIPSNIQEGSAQFSSAKGKGENITLVVAGGLYNVADATCGTVCIDCCGGSGWGLVPATFNCLPGQGVSLDTLAVDCHGQPLYPNSWSSDTPSVATVDGSGNVSCVAGGSVTIYGQWVGAIMYTGQCCSAETPSCPTSSPSAGSNGLVQIPTSLSIVGIDSTTSEASCSAGSFGTGCGVTRSFIYQVNDQESPPKPIQIAGLQIWDAINTTTPNTLNITAYNTTCVPANTGPCGVTTNSSGQFGENNPGLSVCSTVCRVNGACTTGGPTNATQTVHVESYTITRNLSYYCNHITVNGQ